MDKDGCNRRFVPYLGEHEANLTSQGGIAVANLIPYIRFPPLQTMGHSVYVLRTDAACDVARLSEPLADNHILRQNTWG